MHLERALKAQLWFCRRAALCLLAVLAYPFVVMAVAAFLNVWP